MNTESDKPKTKLGRKRAALDGGTRSERITLRATEAEFEILGKLAEEKGMSRTAYILQSTVYADLVPAGSNKSEVDELVEELRALRQEVVQEGNNLNQLIRALHTALKYDDYDAARNAISKVDCAIEENKECARKILKTIVAIPNIFKSVKD